MKAIDGGDGLPREPDWALIFDDDLEQASARDYWLAVVGAMRSADTIAIVNAHACRRLVEAYIHYDRASLILASDGAVNKARRKTPRKSPAFMIMRQMADMATSLEAELGLSPRRRSSATKVTRGTHKKTASDNYLKSVSR